MATANNGYTTTVQALLDAKADASVRSINGYTALMIAERREHTATAQLLSSEKRQAAEAEAGVAASNLQETFEPALTLTQTEL